MKTSKIRWFFDHLEYLLSMLFMGVMVCLLFIQVVSRYAFGHTLAFTEEISVILFILSVYIGAIGATRRGQHLRIELFTQTLSPRGQTICRIIANIIFIIVNCILGYGTCLIVANLFKFGMTTPIVKLPKWIPYAVIPVAFLLISIRLVEDTIRQFKILKTGEYDFHANGEAAPADTKKED